MLRSKSSGASTERTAHDKQQSSDKIYIYIGQNATRFCTYGFHATVAYTNLEKVVKLHRHESFAVVLLVQVSSVAWGHPSNRSIKRFPLALLAVPVFLSVSRCWTLHRCLCNTSLSHVYKATGSPSCTRLYSPACIPRMGGVPWRRWRHRGKQCVRYVEDAFLWNYGLQASKEQ